MTDDMDAIAAGNGWREWLKRTAAYVASATPAPWWYDEDDQCWRLHGTAFWTERLLSFPPLPVNWQILKAAKKGTPYAEYSPNEADATFIVEARTDLPPLLALALNVADIADQLDEDADTLDSQSIPEGRALDAHMVARAERVRDLKQTAETIRGALSDAHAGREPWAE